MENKFLASIHDVGPKFESEVDRLVALYHNLGISRFAMLVVPNHWGEAPLSSSAAFQTQLRSWADAGIEMFVHGWFHKDEARHTGFAGLKAKHMTAGEGEFLGLSYADASFRMNEGRSLIEDIIGRSVAGFVAPAWLYSPGARRALSNGRFAIAEDHMKVWSPLDGSILAKGPVITWASRSPARIASSLAVAAVAPLALRHQPVVRMAVHPGDVHIPRLVRSIEGTLAKLSQHRQVVSYANLLAETPTAIGLAA